MNKSIILLTFAFAQFSQAMVNDEANDNAASCIDSAHIVMRSESNHDLINGISDVKEKHESEINEKTNNEQNNAINRIMAQLKGEYYQPPEHQVVG